MEERLEQIAAALSRGEPSPSMSVRDFLWLDNAQKRGYYIVRIIREKLAQAGLRTTPDFEDVWIDSPIEFQRLISKSEVSEAVEHSETLEEVQLSETGSDDAAGPIWVTREATYRISRLKAANKSVTWARPDESLAQVTTKMMAGGFSQLPIMTTERDVKGIVSWHTIGSRLALGRTGGTAQQMSDPHHEIRADRSIFDAIPIIMAHDYVMVRDDQSRISGIITAADLSLQFRELTEPFLLLSEIENLLRNIIADRFSSGELSQACEAAAHVGSTITSVSDLNFGEYIRLLQNPERWSRIDIAVDRTMFCERLDQVREIRNDVMHFDPEGIGETELVRLRDFTRFLQQLAHITGRS